jgi:hypothetical protein
MPPEPWCLAQARSLHARNFSYIRSTRTCTVVVDPPRRTGAGRGVDLLARLAFSSKRFPTPHRRLAPRRIYSGSGLSTDGSRLSARNTRSPVAHDSHDEAPAVDDGWCTATSSGGAPVPAGVRVTEALHQEPSSPCQCADAVARKLSSASRVVLAGGHDRGNRVAYSRCVSVGHAVPVAAQL